MRTLIRGIAALILVGQAAVVSMPVAGAIGVPRPILTVSVTLPNGQPAQGFPVVVAAEWAPDVQHATVVSGESQMPLTRLAAGSTTARGTLSVSFPSELASASAGGSTNVPVTLLIGDGPVYVFHAELSARAPSARVLKVTLPLQRPFASTSSGRPCPSIVPFDRYWRRGGGGNYIDRDAAVGRVRTLNKTAASMSWSTSKETSTEVFASAGGGLYAAGLKRLTSQTSSTKFDTKPGAGGKEYRVSVRYLPWDLWCRNNATGETWITPTYEWRPDAWTGGSSKANWSPWDCRSDYRVSVTGALTIGSSQTVTQHFEAGVAVLKVTGRTSQQYSSGTAVSLTYKLAPGAKKAFLCGQSNYPARAGEVIEVS